MVILHLNSDAYSMTPPTANSMAVSIELFFITCIFFVSLVLCHDILHPYARKKGDPKVASIQTGLLHPPEDVSRVLLPL